MRIPLLCDDLPPAGHPLLWRLDDAPLPSLPGMTSIGLHSGTAALAAAMLLARLRRSGVAAPQVILPGYGCPDLVAAVRFAGVEPLLVDIGGDDPGYDLDALHAALSPRVVAVVAVNFLGIAERLSTLRALLNSSGFDIALIEDDAQWFPELESQVNAARGDLVCTSFGRGKPVSLLGGGLLWVDADHAALIPQLPIVAAQTPGSSFRLKTFLINALLRPRLYGLVNRNPLIELGRTCFKPLSELRTLDPLRAALLPLNVATHLARVRDSERALASLLAETPTLIDLPAAAGERAGRLLRYPLLCRDRAQRDAIWQALHNGGLGATAMYQRVLPEVEGVGEVTVAGALSGARHFAGRLLTLPVHAGVGPRHLSHMVAALRACR